MAYLRRRVLLDENLPHAMRTDLPRHELCTVEYMGWSGITNGDLLARAAADSFDAFVTVDRGIEHEQNLKMLPLAVIMLQVPSNSIDDLRPIYPLLDEALDHLVPKSFSWVRSPNRRPR